MQHLAWLLDLIRAKDAGKRGEITLLNADNGLDGKKEFSKEKYTNQDKPGNLSAHSFQYDPWAFYIEDRRRGSGNLELNCCTKTLLNVTLSQN